MKSIQATAAETAAYFERFPQMQTQRLGRTGLTVSAAGFGGYRIDAQNSTHRAALTEALTRGINLIDTSSNYGDGGSEQLVGEVLQAAPGLTRSQIVVVTKGGYLQGQNYAISQQRKAGGTPWPDLVEYANGLEHCLHPDFLADQISRSLQRLQLEKIDVYLLHNPEYYLGWAKKNDMPLVEARAEYRRRLDLAFRYLEQEVARGRIGWYGVSSNGFPNPADAYDFTSVAELWEIASAIEPDHHFAVIQLPLNLLETGGFTEKSQPHGRSPVEEAAAHALGVLVNRPLNAVVGNNLVRLADVPSPEQPADAESVHELIEALHHHEERLQQAVFATELPFRTKQEFAATMAAGRLLSQRWSGFGTLSNWRDVQNGYLRPRSQFGTQFLRRRPELPPESAAWVDAYEQVFEATLAAVAAVYQGQEQEMIDQILANVGAADPAWGGAPSMSRAALRALRTTAGISSVLVGMRRPPYVAEVVAEFETDLPVKPRAKGWAALEGMTEHE